MPAGVSTTTMGASVDAGRAGLAIWGRSPGTTLRDRARLAPPQARRPTPVRPSFVACSPAWQTPSEYVEHAGFGGPVRVDRGEDVAVHVSVHEDHAQAAARERQGQIERHRGLAGAALGARHGDDVTGGRRAMHTAARRGAARLRVGRARRGRRNRCGAAGSAPGRQRNGRRRCEDGVCRAPRLRCVTSSWACAMPVASRSSSRTEPTGSDALRGCSSRNARKNPRRCWNSRKKASLPWSAARDDERTLPLITTMAPAIRTILGLELDSRALRGRAQDLEDIRQTEILEASFHDGGFRCSVHAATGFLATPTRRS